MQRPTVLLAVLASVLMVACGDDEAGTGSTASTTTGAAAAAGFPVTLTDSYGTATIDKAPERVAAIGFNEEDFVLALGVKPVAVRTLLGSFDARTRPWAPEANADPKPSLVGATELSFEKIAAARPDLILGIYSFMTKGDYTKLSQLAPTIANGKGYADGTTPWDQQLLTTGKALGREDKAEQVVADVNGQFDAARKAHPEFAGKTITVAFASGGKTFVLNEDDLRSQYFEDLGFQVPDKYSKGGFEENISSEQLAALDTDVIVLIQDASSKLQDTKVFQNLKASREGRVLLADEAGDFAGALGYNSPLSRPYLLKLAVPRLAAAVDGDPGTTVDPA